MRVKRCEYGAASECKGGENGISSRKPVDQWHRLGKFPCATMPGIKQNRFTLLSVDMHSWLMLACEPAHRQCGRVHKPHVHKYEYPTMHKYLRQQAPSALRVNGYGFGWSGKLMPIWLGLLRSDIMLETTCTRNGVMATCDPYCCWKQVEINTIASGFGWLGPSSAAIQSGKFVASRTSSWFVCTSSTAEHELSKIINNGPVFDRVSNMTGEFRGLKTITQKQRPLAIYVHCGNHSLNLALQDCVKNILFLCDALQRINNIEVLLQSSPKRKTLFSNICQR
ncbi:hypothetical protein PR048_029453 [Dryococelus australis]|uniref:Uncharacterized protein n=1 Tax=Dryococelus australis TaxID=614101 RepID=A0ABQ9GFR2_9NEOP|nr:hypothetical protein PR048_029453 [Dryococelus australis]